MRRFLWVFLPLLIFSLGALGLWRYTERKLAHLLTSGIQTQAAEKLHWAVNIKDIKFNLIPPRMEIQGVQVSTDHHTEWLESLTIKEILVQLDFLNLLAGQIKISLLKVSGMSGSIDLGLLPEQKSSLERLPIEAIFNALDIIAIKIISSEDMNVVLKHKNLPQSVALKGDFYVETSPDGLFYGLKTEAQPQKNISAPAAPSILPPTIRLLTKGLLSPRNLQVKEFHLDSEKTHLSLEGEFQNFPMVITQPEIKGALDFEIEASEIQSWVLALPLPSLLPQSLQLPPILGLFKTQGFFKLRNWTEPEIQIKAQISQSAIHDFKIGDLTADLQLKKNILTTNEIALSHPAALLHIKKGLWNLSKDQVTASAEWKQLNLQELFQQLHLKSIPVELLVAGKFNCGGQLLHRFALECEGGVEGSNLDVKASKNAAPPSIVHLNSFRGEGFVTVSSRQVTYSSSLVLPQSKGRTQGVIDFEKGFTIDFDSDQFNFNDVKALAGLRLEGRSQLQGRTQGDSQRATLDISLNTKDFWFENYGLGGFEGKVNYTDGHLLIDAPKGMIFDSRYLANLDIDLSQKTMKGLVEAPDINVKDIYYALQRIVPIPFSGGGSGKARAQFDGPFSLGQLSYRFEGLLKKGHIASETFDELKWDWQAQNGQVQIENNYIQKGSSLITVKGTANPHGHLNLDVQGNNLKLENSSFLSQYIKTLGGDLSFQMTVNNHILKPDIILNGTVTHTTLSDSELPDSTFKFETTERGQAVDLHLLNNQGQMKLVLPYNPEQSSHLNMSVKDFDFTSIIGLISGSPIRTEYQSALSFDVDLVSPTNTLLESSGKVQVNQFSLARGDQLLRNPKPIVISVNNGEATLRDFAVSGPHSEITATGTRFSPQKIDVQISGRTDLKIFQIFFPFLEELSGPLKGQLHLGGTVEKPEVYGDIDLNETTFRIKGFAPLFDRISSHLEFSQKKIAIEAIRGSFAGGTLAGDGSIDINGIKDVKVSIRSQLRNIEMTVPDHVKTAGSADVVLSGNWFPYTLSGSYRVNQALIDSDFSGDNIDESIRHSIYLPKSLSASESDPLHLDLQIFLDKKIEIKTSKIASFLSGQIQLKGSPKSPSILGTIKTLPKAQLFFTDQVFEIQSGIVKFTESNEINPSLYFDAHAVVDNYEINLLLQGTAKAPQLSLSSQPALEEQDIISLLALGMTTQKLDSQIESSQQAAQTGYQLGSAIISANPLNKEIKQSLGVDVKFSSGFDETKNLALPRVTISKDLIPRKLTATATSSFSENQNYDVRFQYLLNERLSTVVTYERTEGQAASATTGTNQSNTSIFGLDLEYKREFK